MVGLIRFVERGSIALHPGVCFKRFFFLSNANAQVRRYSLPPEKPPKSLGFCQTGRMNQPAPVPGIDHVRGDRRSLARKSDDRPRSCFRKESLQRRLRLSETAPSQTQGDQRQQHHGAQKKSPRRALQRAKPPEPFPHKLGELGATRYPRAGPEVPSGWSEATPARHRILQEAPGRPRQCSANPSRAATFTCRSRRNRNTAPSRDSAKPIPDPKCGTARGLAWRLGPQMKPSVQLLGGIPALNSTARGRLALRKVFYRGLRHFAGMPASGRSFLSPAHPRAELRL